MGYRWGGGGRGGSKYIICAPVRFWTFLWSGGDIFSKPDEGGLFGKPDNSGTVQIQDILIKYIENFYFSSSYSEMEISKYDY